MPSTRKQKHCKIRFFKLRTETKGDSCNGIRRPKVEQCKDQNPLQTRVLKMNIDESSHEHPGQAGIGLWMASSLI